MVLFLFVIMLLGGEKLPYVPELRRQWWIGGLMGVVFLIEIGLYVVMRGNPGGIIPLSGLTFSTPGTIGQRLFSKYLLPFEITSILLLAAVIGAIFLTRGTRQPKAITPPGQKEKED
jgi:NADH-quinone oxidoreductase subunit J